jgi:tetratricopeptide (TPR) repeat protein
MKPASHILFVYAALCSTVVVPASAQTTTTPGTYEPGVTIQATNPNYPVRNPFYFEGKVDWNLLHIDVPKDAWEYEQRGLHYQDDLDDIPDAIADYRQALSLNSLDNGSCQIITTAVASGQTVDPPPCMFTVRLRLGYLLHEEDPAEAIKLFQEVLQIDPLRLGVNSLIGETYVSMAEHATTEADKDVALENAVTAFKAELALSPVTPISIQVTGDQANNAHVHWELAEIYEELGQTANAAGELDQYLKATQWHSDTYPWRIQLAEKRLEHLRQEIAPRARRPEAKR